MKEYERPGLGQSAETLSATPCWRQHSTEINKTAKGKFCRKFAFVDGLFGKAILKSQRGLIPLIAAGTNMSAVQEWCESRSVPVQSIESQPSSEEEDVER